MMAIEHSRHWRLTLFTLNAWLGSSQMEHAINRELLKPTRAEFGIFLV
jgi:hypothetical protein